MFPGQCGNTAFFFKSQPDQFHFEFRGIVFPGKSFFSAHEVSTCKISGCLSYRILDSGPDGTQTTLTEAARQLLNETASEGILADGAMTVAEFMGFSRDVGLGIFNATTLAANVYGVFGLTGKAEAWRLFRYLPGDYYRKVETMSPGRLTMKVLGWGVSAKVVLELLTHDQNRSR